MTLFLYIHTEESTCLVNYDNMHKKCCNTVESYKSCVVDWHRVVALSYNVVHSIVSSSVPGHTGSVSSSGTGGRVAAVEAATWQSILR